MHFQNEPASSEPTSARCAKHPSASATTICSRCGSYACTQCQYVGVNGQDYCVDCFLREGQGQVLAGRGERFIANLVDQFIIFLPWFGAVFLEVLLSEANVEQGVRSGPISLLGLLGTLAIAVYQLYLVSRNGQTIGKRMMKIRVVRTDGSRVSLGRILVLRNLIPGGLGSLCGLFSLIDALLIFNEDRRCVHDMLADTKVIKASSESGDV
ncbi:MAG: RDD family protein [Myxococcaceae bacterium]|nr:RDD family protein [Myxococcaceae bacterium]